MMPVRSIIYLYSDLPGPIPDDEIIMNEVEELNLESTYKIVYRCLGGNRDSAEPQLFLDAEGRAYFLIPLREYPNVMVQPTHNRVFLNIEILYRLG